MIALFSIFRQTHLPICIMYSVTSPPFFVKSTLFLEQRWDRCRDRDRIQKLQEAEKNSFPTWNRGEFGSMNRTSKIYYLYDKTHSPSTNKKNLIFFDLNISHEDTSNSKTMNIHGKKYPLGRYQAFQERFCETKSPPGRLTTTLLDVRKVKRFMDEMG